MRSAEDDNNNIDLGNPFPAVSTAYLSGYILCIIMARMQIVKWGNSLAVRIPKPVAEEAGVREGDAIVIEAAKGQINLRRKQRIPTLQELVARITAENRHGETSSGPARATEEVEW